MNLMKRYNKPLLYATLILNTLLLSTGCDSKEEEKNETHVQTLLPDQENQVSVTVLQNTEFNHELVSNGTISAQAKADLYFESPEVLQEIYVKNGQQVVKGQKLAMLTQFKLQSAVRQAEDNIEKANLELQDVLISQGYVLRDSLQIPPEILRIAKVKSNYENSVIQLELAKYNLQNSVLYAPHDGVIANLYSKPYNMPPSGQPFCTLIGSKAMDADFVILESELELIKLGDAVEILPFALSKLKAMGRIIEINPIVDEQGMVKVKARIQGTNAKLYEGMNVKVRIRRSVGQQIIIPKSALVLRSNRKVVFTVMQGKARWNYVETSFENSEGYVVTDGLKAGDSVIYEGNLNLANEAPIKVIGYTEESKN